MNKMTVVSLKSILIGAFGTLILALFCTTFIRLDKVLAIIPVFIAFNGCLTGFRMVEQIKKRLPHLGFFSFIMGLGGGAVTFSVVNLTGRIINNPFALTFFDMFLYLFLSGVTSYLGARLAVRYFNL